MNLNSDTYALDLSIGCNLLPCDVLHIIFEENILLQLIVTDLFDIDVALSSFESNKSLSLTDKYTYILNLHVPCLYRIYAEFYWKLCVHRTNDRYFFCKNFIRFLYFFYIDFSHPTCLRYYLRHQWNIFWVRHTFFYYPAWFWSFSMTSARMALWNSACQCG